MFTESADWPRNRKKLQAERSPEAFFIHSCGFLGLAQTKSGIPQTTSLIPQTKWFIAQTTNGIAQTNPRIPQATRLCRLLTR